MRVWRPRRSIFVTAPVAPMHAGPSPPTKHGPAPPCRRSRRWPRGREEWYGVACADRLRGRARESSPRPQLERAAEGDVRVERDLLVLDELEPGPAVEQPLDRQLRLELAEAGAGAVVDALAEGEAVVRVLAPRVEAPGLGERLRVAARRGEPQEQLRALGELHAAQRHRPR